MAAIVSILFMLIVMTEIAVHENNLSGHFNFDKSETECNIIFNFPNTKQKAIIFFKLLNGGSKIYCKNED